MNTHTHSSGALLKHANGTNCDGGYKPKFNFYNYINVTPAKCVFAASG